MRYEVEQKFPVADMPAVEARLAALGGAPAAAQVEVDCYYNHPARDFAVTDEALRIRSVGSVTRMTYKGPKLDAATKTRREIDLPLPADSSTAWDEILLALGFRRVAEVRKSRRKVFLDWQGRRVEVSLDEVDRLGTFVELELVTDADGIEAAKSCLAALAETLQLSGSQRRSYLELLLSQ